MTEKVIGEIRFIETDDGYRIEVKGDKEQMKEMGWGPGMGRGFMGMGRGRKRFWREMRREHKHGQDHKHGPRHGRHDRHAGHAGPWFCGGWEDDYSEESSAYEKPPKSV